MRYYNFMRNIARMKNNILKFNAPSEPITSLALLRNVLFQCLYYSCTNLFIFGSKINIFNLE